jgi:uncharacterized damage-inducible protein DinB
MTTRWFDRKFEFSFGLDAAPELIASLRATPSILEEALRGASAQSLTDKPGGKWSAQQHAGHLLDLEPLWLARMDDFASGADRLTPADLTNRKTEEANHNARPLAAILSDFRDARERLVCRAVEFDRALMGRAILHPRLEAPRRVVDHLYFVAEHDGHHLAAIRRLLEQRAAQPQQHAEQRQP